MLVPRLMASEPCHLVSEAVGESRWGQRCYSFNGGGTQSQDACHRPEMSSQFSAPVSQGGGELPRPLGRGLPCRKPSSRPCRVARSVAALVLVNVCIVIKQPAVPPPFFLLS